MSVTSLALRHKKSALAILRIICVVAIFWLISIKIRLPDFHQFTRTEFIVAMVVAGFLNIFQSVVCTVRWSLIARRSSPPSFLLSFWAYLEGCFFNQALPSFVGGDAVRVMRWHENGVAVGAASVAVFLDRIFGALGAAMLALAACFLLRHTPVEQYKILLTGLLSAGIVSISCAILIWIRWSPFRNLFESHARLWSLMAVILDWRPNAKETTVLVILGVAGQVLAGLAVYALALALHIALSPVLMVSVTGIILLLSMIPISLAGWGVREAGFIALLVPLGVDSSLALTLGVAFGLSALAGALPGGISVLFGLARPRNSDMF